MTPTNLMKLKEYWLAGFSTKDCARLFDLHEQSIRHWVKVLDLKPKAEGRPRKLVTKQQKEAIEKYFGAGQDCDTIGFRFGISGRTVRNYCSSSALLWERKESVRRNRLEDKLQIEAKPIEYLLINRDINPALYNHLRKKNKND